MSVAKLLYLFYPVLLCLPILLLVAPATMLGVDDLRLSWYFDFDEGDLLERLLAFRAGTLTRDFAGSLFFDYGPLFKTVAVPFTLPFTWFMGESYRSVWVGVRWFNVVSGQAALWIFWLLVVRHFRSFWVAAISTTALAVTPEFLSWLDHVKPEPFQLMLVALSLYFSVSLVRRPRLRTVALASLFASAAFATKYLGVFLLPGIVLAWCGGDWLQNGRETLQAAMERRRRHLYTFGIALAFAGALGLIAFAVFLFSYVGKTTGLTWFEQYGWRMLVARWESVITQGLSLSICLGGLGLVWLSRRQTATSSLVFLGQFVLLCLTQVSLLFVCGLLVAGYQWFLHPLQFVRDFHARTLVVTSLGNRPFPETLSMLAPMSQWIEIIAERSALGMIGATLLTLYAIGEIVLSRTSRHNDIGRLLMRLTLFLFVVSYGLFLWLLVDRRTGWYLLPIVPLAFLLPLDLLRHQVLPWLPGLRWRAALLLTVTILFVGDALYRGSLAYQWRVARFQKPYDVAYELSRWLEKQYDVEMTILTDHRDQTFVPSTFTNVAYLGYEPDRDTYLDRSKHSTVIMIFNTTPGVHVDAQKSAVSELIGRPGVHLVRSFEGLHQQRNNVSKYRFEVYERRGK